MNELYAAVIHDVKNQLGVYTPLVVPLPGVMANDAARDLSPRRFRNRYGGLFLFLPS